MGRALQIPDALIAAFSKEHPGMYSRSVLAERLESAIARVHELHGERVAIPNAKLLAQWLELSHQLQRFPRPLRQPVGGFALTYGPSTRLGPV